MRIHPFRSNLELVDLALFVVLELVHVLLELLDFGLGLGLLPLGFFDGRLELSDLLLVGRDIGTNLARM